MKNGLGFVWHDHSINYVGGSGEWATGADDDDYEDECVAETWRDGGVLSEADA